MSAEAIFIHCWDCDLTLYPGGACRHKANPYPPEYWTTRFDEAEEARRRAVSEDGA